MADVTSDDYMGEMIAEQAEEVDRLLDLLDFPVHEVEGVGLVIAQDEYEAIQRELRRRGANPTADEGERVKGWVANLHEGPWPMPDKGALHRRTFEFVAGQKPVTRDAWTPATLILHDTPPESEGDDE